MCYLHDQPGWQAGVLRLVDVFIDGCGFNRKPRSRQSRENRKWRGRLNAWRRKISRQAADGDAHVSCRRRRIATAADEARSPPLITAPTAAISPLRIRRQRVTLRAAVGASIRTTSAALPARSKPQSRDRRVRCSRSRQRWRARAHPGKAREMRDGVEHAESMIPLPVGVSVR